MESRPKRAKLEDTVAALRARFADPAQRSEDPVGAVHPVEESVDLRAQLALGERVLGIAGHVNGPTVLHRHHPTARVGTVVMAGAVDAHAPTLPITDVAPLVARYRHRCP